MFVEFLSNQTVRGCVKTCSPAEGEFAALKEEEAEQCRKGLKLGQVCTLYQGKQCSWKI